MSDPGAYAAPGAPLLETAHALHCVDPDYDDTQGRNLASSASMQGTSIVETPFFFDEAQVYIRAVQTELESLLEHRAARTMSRYVMQFFEHGATCPRNIVSAVPTHAIALTRLLVVRSDAAYDDVSVRTHGAAPLRVFVAAFRMVVLMHVTGELRNKKTAIKHLVEAKPHPVLPPTIDELSEAVDESLGPADVSPNPNIAMHMEVAFEVVDLQAAHLSPPEAAPAETMPMEPNLDNQASFCGTAIAAATSIPSLDSLEAAPLTDEQRLAHESALGAERVAYTLAQQAEMANLAAENALAFAQVTATKVDEIVTRAAAATAASSAAKMIAEAKATE
eukprot:CAMPEP_0183365158 /NCGR_PEP_ID=MMETSP0164_2-20130417/83624_1 /TAXON_ID=221442 /ORGANISM="Coccolithus pelagicus ssp braarudi, Strain PLY182g" /LENGTH=334 /DNA_ID=CAMNT_0025540629 /DNA_START=219 /DNA_END=1223 /DNA_ORIENTATION=+